MTDYEVLRAKLNDHHSIFYGPHPCPFCGLTIVRRELARGGHAYDDGTYELHTCPPVPPRAREFVNGLQQPEPTALPAPPIALPTPTQEPTK